MHPILSTVEVQTHLSLGVCAKRKHRVKTLTKRILLGLVVMGLSAGSLLANLGTVQLVNNGNFQSGFGQSGINSPGNFTGINFVAGSPYFIADWTVTGHVDWIGSHWSAPNSVGGFSADLGGSSAAGTISQTIDTVVNQTYTLTFYLSGNIVGPPLPAGRLLEVSAANSGNLAFFTEDYTTGSSALKNQWQLETFLFTATSGHTTISFQSRDNIHTSVTSVLFGPVVSGVSLMSLTSTPEPGFYGVLALGLAGLFLVVRRRRSA